MELIVPSAIKEAAKAYVVPNQHKFAKRGIFDGTVNQKIMGHVGLLMARRVLGARAEDMDLVVDGEADLWDFQIEGKSYDVKTTYSTHYRELGTPPWDWGVLVPEVQAKHKIHDYYIRCVIDGNTLETLTRCLFLCACMGQAVREAPVEALSTFSKGVVPFRVVARKHCFPVEQLIRPVKTVPRPCPACGTTTWWVRPGGTELVCGVCHPNPATL